MRLGIDCSTALICGRSMTRGDQGILRLNFNSKGSRANTLSGAAFPKTRDRRHRPGGGNRPFRWQINMRRCPRRYVIVWSFLRARVSQTAPERSWRLSLHKLPSPGRTNSLARSNGERTEPTAFLETAANRLFLGGPGSRKETPICFP
jgi:hypothetical protein